jgi:hypothetical protein
MTMKGKKWWAWQGLNLRPLRCQHSGYRSNPHKTAKYRFAKSDNSGTRREHRPIRADSYRDFTAIAVAA